MLAELKAKSQIISKKPLGFVKTHYITIYAKTHRRSEPRLTEDQSQDSQKIRAKTHRRSEPRLTEDQSQDSQKIRAKTHRRSEPRLTEDQSQDSQKIRAKTHKRSRRRKQRFPESLMKGGILRNSCLAQWRRRKVRGWPSREEEKSKRRNLLYPHL